MYLVVEVVEIAGARLVLLPQKTLHNPAEILRFVVRPSQGAGSAIRVVVDLLLGLNYCRYVLNLESVVAKVKVVGGVEAAAAVNPLVRNEVGEASEDVSAHFALVNQIAFPRQQLTQLGRGENQ